MGQTSCKQAGPRLSGDDDEARLRLSIIIPALNESACIAAALSSVHSAAVAPVDVLVVDGGSTDNTVQVAEQSGAEVIRADRGRGRQMNAGWRATRGDWCLFLHGDSQLPPRYDERIAASLFAAQQQRQPRAGWASGGARPAPREAKSVGPAEAREPCSPAATPAVIATTTAAGTTATASQTCRRNCSGCCRANGASKTPSGKASISPGHANDDRVNFNGCCCRQGNCGSDGCGRDEGPCPGSASNCGRDRGDRGFAAAQWAWQTAVHGRGWARGGGADAATVLSDQPTWGAFATFTADLRNPLLRALLSAGVELRTRLLHRPYGDQAIFVRRDILEASGGFVEWPLLEDLELVQRLSREQPPVIVDAPIATSGRRWQSVGFLQTTLINQAILAAYAMGTPPETLAQWYRGAKRDLGSK